MDIAVGLPIYWVDQYTTTSVHYPDFSLPRVMMWKAVVAIMANISTKKNVGHVQTDVCLCCCVPHVRASCNISTDRNLFYSLFSERKPRSSLSNQWRARFSISEQAIVRYCLKPAKS